MNYFFLRGCSGFLTWQAFSVTFMSVTFSSTVISDQLFRIPGQNFVLISFLGQENWWVSTESSTETSDSAAQLEQLQIEYLEVIKNKYISSPFKFPRFLIQ